MDYFKSYKSNKNVKRKSIFIAVTIVFIVLFLFIQIQPKSIISENMKNSDEIEDLIENTSRYIVGISSEKVEDSKDTITWGSGIIVSRQGFIVTNEHVCGNVNSVCNVIIDNNQYPGKVIWDSESLDLAIIKVSIEFNDCINIKENSDLKLGQEVYSIGNPISKSFQKTISKGIISGLNRSLEFEEEDKTFYMNDLIQTDCAINYGCSGGALIDTHGDLIGINTAKISDAILMSFAIPAEIIKPIIYKIEEGGSNQSASLKIWCYDRYSVYEADNPKKIDSGVLVADVLADSNAEKAGVRVGDIIKYVDTEEVNSILNLKKIIFSKNVGDKVLLKISRNDKEMYINVELEAQE